MRSYGNAGRLLPGDLGYRDSQYDADQAEILAREDAALARERFEGPFTREDVGDAAAEESVDAFLLRRAVERAAAKLDEIAERPEWMDAPWGVRFDVTTVRRNLRAVLAREP